MSKKEPVPFKNPDELDAIDDELSEAMAGLDGANARIEDLLSGIQPPAPTAGAMACEEESEVAEEPSED